MNCHACGREVPEDELIRLVDRWICPTCKPRAIQELQEGAFPPLVTDLRPDDFDERILGYGRFLALSWKLWRKDWPAIVGLTVLVSIPSNLILVALGFQEAESGRDFFQQIRIVGLLQVFIGVIASLGVAHVVHERLQ